MATVIASPSIPRRWAPIVLPVARIPQALLGLVPMVLALLASPAIYLSVTSEAVTLGASAESMRVERENWRNQNRQLELELAKLQSLAYVESEAVSRFQMRRATPAVFVRMDRPSPPSRRVLLVPLARTDAAPGASVPGPFAKERELLDISAGVQR